MVCDFDILLYIAENADLYGKLKKSTIKIAKELKASQQTISRRIDELAKKGFLEKNSSLSGVEVKLKNKGVEALKKRRDALNSIFEESDELEGRVFLGFGEGKYYMKNYKSRLKKKLGFNPYEGTLNARVDHIELKKFLHGLKKVRIDEFSTKERSFGAVDCYPVVIEDKIKGAIVIPNRNKYEGDVVEIIAPVYLRKALKVNDNDIVKMKVVK